MDAIANVKHKNSVFSLLFSDPNLLRELYCALEDVSLPDNVPVTINTLENVLFMGLKNDISFVVGGKMVVLIEHQSTSSPNLALRLLLYIARVYEKTFRDSTLYSGKRVLIPRPEFFVLYNGTEPCPDEEIIRLSDAFEKVDELGLPEKAKPALDLEVRVLNINEGRNAAIAARCRKLAEYSAFIAKVRYFLSETGGDKEAAMKAAIKYCREHDILREFLEQHSAEVFSMLITEWDTEEAKKVWYQEGTERGIEIGAEREREKANREKLQDKLHTAANLKMRGVSPDIITESTGLSAEEINTL